MEFEKRNFKLELRIRKKDGKTKIHGYSAVFNKLSEDLGGFREKIEKGAFKDALKTSDPRMLFNHDPNFILGRKSAGTLRVKEDLEGLYVEADAPNTRLISDMVISPMERGDIREMSFGFLVESDKWEGLESRGKDEMPVRTILKVAELFDVSPVTYPAYPDTKVALRSLRQSRKPSLSTDLLTKIDNMLSKYMEGNYYNEI